MKYQKHAVIFLGFFSAISLLAYFLVAHHLSIPDAAEQRRASLLRNGLSVSERIKPVAQVSFLVADPAKTDSPRPVVNPAATRDGAQVYKESCDACHGPGIAGSPRLGDKPQWTTRTAKGLSTLYSNALNGVQGPGGIMPAKGGNPALTEAEVKSAVDFIIARSQ